MTRGINKIICHCTNHWHSIDDVNIMLGRTFPGTHLRLASPESPRQLMKSPPWWWFSHMTMELAGNHAGHCPANTVSVHATVPPKLSGCWPLSCQCFQGAGLCSANALRAVYKRTKMSPQPQLQPDNCCLVRHYLCCHAENTNIIIIWCELHTFLVQ